ncbi:MAG: indolepyruvate ferredoxin oxidoreductase subunit alpha [Spirochaetota bacterium]
MKALLSGNQAIARGAWEYGVNVAAGYPGTPSTEILENLSRYREVYSEWAPNEKVALEVAIGACLTGVRSMATMKHVGLNVASDPLMTCSYTGVNGGLVVVVADDPGMHSSQNEQDSRNYARFAKVPLFEPSDSGEAKQLLQSAFRVSEEYDTPVLFRTTTRISHSRGMVELHDPINIQKTPHYEKNPHKYLMVPAYARKRRLEVEKRTEKLKAYAEQFSQNTMILREKTLGIITSSIAYQYAAEVFDEASILKLAMSYPFPDELIAEFAAEVDALMVVEELDPFLTDHIKSLGFLLTGIDLIPRTGELDLDILENAKKALVVNKKYFASPSPAENRANTNPDTESLKNPASLPSRPPVLCPGCPHRGVFYVLKALKPIIIGDIGCYSLGGLPPLESMDAIFCMGGGISAAAGVAKAGPDRPVVGIVGDSTFFHSGITGLLDIGYNHTSLTILVLDNSITAMTGHQDHPGTGKTLMGNQTIKASIAKFAQAAGINMIKVFDPYSLEETKRAIEEAVNAEEASVLVSRRPCVLLERHTAALYCSVDMKACKSCGICLKLGCPAIYKINTEEGAWSAAVNKELCTGCSLCAQVCPFDAISFPPV